MTELTERITPRTWRWRALGYDTSSGRASGWPLDDAIGTPSAVRRPFISLRSGFELNVVRSWLGHASIETTHAYIEIDLQMKRAALEACQPPGLDSPAPSWREPDLLTWLEAL